MALSYQDEFQKAMPYLEVALGHRPNDYTLNHYAGINQKLRSDRLPDTEQSLKQELWSAAIVYCETARRNFPARKQGKQPSWNDRFFFIHWCVLCLPLKPLLALQSVAGLFLLQQQQTSHRLVATNNAYAEVYGCCVSTFWQL